jgi:hypothetical protein
MREMTKKESDAVTADDYRQMSQPERYRFLRVVTRELIAEGYIVPVEGGFKRTAKQWRAAS